MNDFSGFSEILVDQFKVIEDKISASHESVDEVITQIEYIKMLSKNDHILDDLETELLQL